MFVELTNLKSKVNVTLSGFIQGKCMLFEVKSLSVTLSGMSNDRMGRGGGMGVKDIVNTITLPRGNKWRLNDPFVCDLLAIRSAIGVRLKVI